MIGDKQPEMFQKGQRLTASALNSISTSVLSLIQKLYGPRIKQPLDLTVTLDEALAAATDSLTSPATATASVMRRNTNGDLEDAGYNITVVNRSTSSVDSGAIGVAQWTDGEWRLVLSGGSGGSDCCCTCVCVDPNLQDPDGFLTVRDWTIPLSTSAWVRASNDNGHIRVKEASRSFSWNSTTERWEYTLTTSDVDWRNDNDEISVPTTVTGSAYMDWTSTTDPVVIRVDFDATGNIYVPFP
jgi:hypothetical protein